MNHSLYKKVSHILGKFSMNHTVLCFSSQSRYRCQTLAVRTGGSGKLRHTYNTKFIIL
uniref:Uncharacterized protein n=1 Tax=Anguilla anguilla TaxID=7936 RepID=A0A0E9P6I8_ANGAN